MKRSILHARAAIRLRHASRTAPLALALALAGCNLSPVGPDRPPPAPSRYAAQPQPETTTPADGVSQHFDVGAELPPQWWREFGSPVLDGWVEEGLRSSPTLDSVAHSLASARLSLQAAVAETALPTVDAGASAERQRTLGIPGLTAPTVTYNTFVGQVQASYDFDLFGQTRQANQALAARVDVQAFELDAARRALAANIVSAALQSAALHEELDARRRIAELARAERGDTVRRQVLGAASALDIQEAERAAAAATAAVPGLRAQWLAARHALAVLMGRTPDAAPEDIPLASLTLPPELPVAVPSDLLRSRPDIRAADAAVAAAAAEVGAATARMFPSLSLTAAFGQGGFTWPGATSAAGRLWSLSGGLTQPLFHGGALRAQRQAAIETYAAAQASYRQTVLRAFQDVANTLVALQEDAGTVAASANAHEQARRSLEGTRRRVALGALPETATRAQEQQEREAWVSLCAARARRLADTASLFQAMGDQPGPAGDAAR